MAENESQSDSPLAVSVEKLRHELDRWLDFAVTQGERAIGAIRPKGSEGRWKPAVDVVESDEEILVVADLPGVEPSSVDVSLAGNLLTISGDKPATESEEGQTVHTAERLHGSFSCSIPMPVAVNPDSVAAETSNGVLRIRLGKAERVKSHKIQINTGEGSAS